MTNPYRAMCAELLADYDNRHYRSELSDRARALLAQPVAKRPTVMEIIELHSWLEDEQRANNDGEDLPTLDFARAVLAKWGRQ
jgi:Lon protease-like protein